MSRTATCADWSEVTLDLASVGTVQDTINYFTVDNPSDPMVLLVDDVIFDS